MSTPTQDPVTHACRLLRDAASKAKVISDAA